MEAPSAGNGSHPSAPVIGVTVYPGGARVTRRMTVELPPGERELVIRDLPDELEPDSVRVSGRGPARVLGVDVPRRTPVTTPESALATLERRRRELSRRLDETADEQEITMTAHRVLEGAGRTGAAALARALAAGSATGQEIARGDGEATRLLGFTDLLTGRLTALRARHREADVAREEVERELASVDAEIARGRTPHHADRRDIVVTVEAHADGGGETAAAVELDVSYQVPSAGWTSVYDARLEGETVTLTWFSMVTQWTGEDWPACPVTLSTARPSVTTTPPELQPWYVDIRRPVVFRSRASASGRRAGGRYDATEAMAPSAPAAAPMATAAQPPPPPVTEAVAEVDSGGAAATFRLGRPLAVRSDRTPHRATVTVIELDASLDYRTVPKISPEAYLRATVTNTAPHTLLPGAVAVFHGADFVGTTRLELVPPGAEIELPLGIDDRLKVERELTRRSTSRKVVGGTRRVDVTYRISLTNHTPLPAKVSVSDQYPVPRHESIVTRDEQATPAPDERTDLGVLTWTLELGPGRSRDIDLSFRLEYPRAETLTNWI